MPPLPARFAGIILAFAPLFVHRAWRHAQLLLSGAILTEGRRTVTSVLHILGRAQERRFVNVHRIRDSTQSREARSRTMPETTPTLALPLIAAGQAQKHVTHNEALIQLDALVQLACRDKDLGAPPASPAEGDRYLVLSAGPTGAWTGLSGQIAQFQDGRWRGLAPKPGWLAWILDADELYVFTAAGWVGFRSTLRQLQTLTRLGIGTTADAANPFAAKLNTALWTALTTAEGGTGDLRYTLNKEAPGNVLSLLFQSAFTGRAEIGLSGNDDLTIKVAPDTGGFREALRVDRATGRVDLAGPLPAPPSSGRRPSA